jgi:GMP synthase (glutamine-hydrolysing)
MRKGENEEVLESYKRAGIKNLTFIDAEERFIDAVKGMQDPEQKRKAIGNMFGIIQQEACERLGIDPDKTYLAQGSLYTDHIESGKGVGKKAANIKSHHNVGCEFIERMKAKGLLVEPNRMIFKDEVRRAAKEIGLPPEIYERQPYPGPGLGIRIVGGKNENLGKEFYDTNSKVSSIADAEMLEGYIVPVRTVGVQGDGRTYSFLTVLRGERDWQRIRNAAARIPKEVRETNRVVYDLSKNTGSYVDLISLVSTTVDKETYSLLQDVDNEGRGIIKKYGFDTLENISQTIFVLFGADPYLKGKRSVALRAVSTDDFMTVKPVDIGEKTLSWNCLDEIHDTLLKKYDIGMFVYDVTDKPPATTCWE